MLALPSAFSLLQWSVFEKLPDISKLIDMHHLLWGALWLMSHQKWCMVYYHHSSIGLDFKNIHTECLLLTWFLLIHIPPIPSKCTDVHWSYLYSYWLRNNILDLLKFFSHLIRRKYFHLWVQSASGFYISVEMLWTICELQVELNKLGSRFLCFFFELKKRVTQNVFWLSTVCVVCESNM